MRALVTGGAGFIGSNLVDALQARGADVTVLDDLSTGRRANLDDALARGARLIEADVVDGEAVTAAFAAARPEVVFHLAAQIDVRRSVADPARDARINVEGTVNVLAAAHAAGARRLVFSSTGGAIYGEADVVPTPEEAPVRAISPYGRAKHAAEGYCALYEQLHGLSTIALRYSNVYGPRQDPLGEGGVVAIFSGRRLAGEAPVVYGDGLQTRDYLHVDDVVRANLLAAEREATGVANVGSGVETTVLDLVDVFAQLGGDDPFEPRFEPPRPGEVRRSCLDAARAAELLGWEPRIDLAVGVRDTLATLAAA
ncbi:NAD-dependent epimerase/dehydratase family protein [Conexibacter arvalis]|uniref:UDP-glucose 4-epimerase n=1 Tax=Conexibacter arvalis TaxID=912552 RepID=A0A840IBE1_9ACTN|nr:UDP-glucose 4-epimerase [Conexibacter arvalis]